MDKREKLLTSRPDLAASRTRGQAEQTANAVEDVPGAARSPSSTDAFHESAIVPFVPGCPPASLGYVPLRWTPTGGCRRRGRCSSSLHLHGRGETAIGAADGILQDRSTARWPDLTELRLRYRSGFAYVDGVLADGDVVNLCRLR